MQYDKGYVSPYFVSDTDKMEVEMDNPLILVTNQKITNLQEILPVLEQVLKANKPLLLIAEDYENEAISSLVLNKLRGAFNVVATKAPGFGDKQKEMLEDIAVLTGAKFYNKELNMKLSDLTIDDLGTIKKVIVKKDNTTLIGHSSSEAVNKRVEELKTQLTHTKSDYEKKTLKERIGKLSNGVATIKVGATTEAELKEKKLRIEDALNATKAAVDEGIVVVKHRARRGAACGVSQAILPGIDVHPGQKLCDCCPDVVSPAESAHHALLGGGVACLPPGSLTASAGHAGHCRTSCQSS